jgi:hypothetical protein
VDIGTSVTLQIIRFFKQTAKEFLLKIDSQGTWF